MAGPGLVDPDRIPLGRGTHTDPETGRQDIADAGPSVGDLAKKALPGMTEVELEQVLKESEAAGEPDEADLHRGQTAGRPDRPVA